VKFSDYIGNIFLFITIVLWIYIFYFIFVSLVIGNILDENYEALYFFLISSGIIIIVFGYWFYAKINAFRRGSPYVEESVDLLLKRRTLNDKLKIMEKLSLYLYEDKYSIKICNRLGIALILIGVIIYVIK